MKMRLALILVVILLSLASQACGIINMDDSYQELNFDPSGSVTIQLPSVGSLNGGGAYHYKFYRGTSKRKLVLNDRVILDPDNGSGPGTVHGDDTVIATGKRVIYIKHDTGKISCVPEEECKLLVQAAQTMTVVMRPPPSCDCGAKAVGSDRHSNWCTISDLTSLN